MSSLGRICPVTSPPRKSRRNGCLVYLGLDVNGMIGAILGVAVLIVIPFTLMGQVLGRTGGAAYFADLAMSSMGRFRGGAAKIAVVGSALFGMISGAAVSNVMAVGIVTIPLMSRSGFSPTRAAAIESVGSTGGQLMPPVMGAAAFIMAEFLQVPYGAVCIAATIPAVLYYAALFMHVDLEAAKHKIGAVQVEHIPAFSDVVKSGWHFPIPILFLIATLIWPEFFQTPIERAAIYSTAMLIGLSLAFGYRGTRVTPRQMLRAILDTGRAAIDIILIGAAAGMVVGALNISGISFGLTLQLIEVSGQSLFVLLLLTAIISIILGMGMPTVSVYVLTASLLAPSIVRAWRATDGRAYVRDVFRHAVDDHSAGGDCRLCRRKYRARVGMDDRLDRRGSGLEYVLHPVPVRHRAEHADECHLVCDRMEFLPQHPRYFRRHRRHRRLRLLCAVGTAAHCLRRRGTGDPDPAARFPGR